MDLLFPPRCFGCDRAAALLCPRCEPGLGVVTPPLCARCGRPWEEPLASCAECPPSGVDAARAPFLYEGPLPGAIKGLKFGGWRRLARHLAGAMGAAWDGDADALTWVPLSPRRRRRRGFDQAELLARAMARLIDLPCRPLLRRVRETPEQARRRADERRRALRHAFDAPGPSPPTVVLVDDVMTTGATAAACAGALRRAGARRVLVLTAARAIRAPAPTRCYGRPPHEAEGAARLLRADARIEALRAERG